MDNDTKEKLLTFMKAQHTADEASLAIFNTLFLMLYRIHKNMPDSTLKESIGTDLEELRKEIWKFSRQEDPTK